MTNCYVYDTFRGSVIYMVIYRKLTLSDKSYSIELYTFLISTEISSNIHEYQIVYLFPILRIMPRFYFALEMNYLYYYFSV